MQQLAFGALTALDDGTQLWVIHVKRTTSTLGLVHRAVGFPHKRFSVTGPVGDREPDRAGERDLVASHLKRLRPQLGGNPTGEFDGVRLVAEVFEDQCELVAAKARHRVSGAQVAAQAPGNFPEQVVTGSVPVGVVDLLEVVHVAHADRDRSLRALRPA